jgi:hypothetical protein
LGGSLRGYVNFTLTCNYLKVLSLTINIIVKCIEKQENDFLLVKSTKMGRRRLVIIFVMHL